MSTAFISTALNQALGHLKAGRLSDAETFCRQILIIDPRQPDACQLLAVVCFNTRRCDEAESLMRIAIATKPQVRELRGNLAAGLRDCGRLPQAIVEYQQLVGLWPDHAIAWMDLGLLLLREGRNREAAESLQRFIALQPQSAEGYCNLANAHNQMNESDAAIAAARRSLSLRPDLVEAWVNLGSALVKKEQWPDAIDAFRQAIRIRPDYPPAQRNLANACFDCHRMDEAEAGLREAIRLQPGFALAHWDLSLVLLRTGRPAEAWAEYQWRRVMPFTRQFRDSQLPEWTGTQPLQGRRILVHGEQGLGDRVQFVRYVTPLVELGARVTIATLPELIQLLQGFEGIEAVVPEDGPLPPVDFHVPMMSLPLLLADRCPPIPAPARYLTADPQKIAIWTRRLEDGTASLKVGLSFAGSPGHANDRHRSIPFQLFAPLLQLPGLRFFSLQKGSAREQMLQSGLPITDLADDLHDFSDTAAAMSALDLTITIDSATAHVAGALGRPTWLLLPFNADARWCLDRDDTAWYPATQLFRQKTLGDWPAVIARVAAEMTSGKRGVSTGA